MINATWGIIWYLLGRNDWVWEHLDESEKAIILEANRAHNTERDDYSNPELYGLGRVPKGEVWDTPTDRGSFRRGKIILSILSTFSPKDILEIGPGPGFYTRDMCVAPTVEHYTGMDINSAFLDYLRPRLEAVKNTKANFNYQLIRDNFLNVSFKNQFDCIILLSTVHHIPNRIDLFKKLHEFLKPGGIIFCMDPSHYILRALSLVRKMIFAGYLKKDFWMERKNLSTHHMCTYGEYKKLARACGFTIISEWYCAPRGICIARHSLLRFFSNEMAIVLQKKIN